MAIFEGKETLLDYVVEGIPDGEHVLVLEANNKNVPIDAEVYNFYENVAYSDNPSLGSLTPDTRMLVLIYHGDLTIGEGVIVTPQVRKKGMTIYVKGTLANYGTVSMTARGAIAEGQNVYLCKNEDGSFEYVPAVGGAGGASSATSANGGRALGKKGTDGVERQTGGGASGGATKGAVASNTAKSGAGSAGTSYSGGAGGGGAGATNGSATATAGRPNGGAGGNAATNSGTTGSTTAPHSAGGGAGNPEGKGALYKTSMGTAVIGDDGSEGTGGLLIIYGPKVFNFHVIESKGSDGGSVLTSAVGYRTGGGASGGGSINIFFGLDAIEGTISSGGGKGGEAAHVNGGDGGDGCVTIQEIPLPSETLRVEIVNKNYDLTVNIHDAENDPFNYKVTLNDKKIFPSNKDIGYSDKPITLYRKLDNDDLIFGEGNVVKVIATGRYGFQTEKTLIIKGDYYGLLFADESKDYYSTNLGGILKRLQVTSVVAGEVSKAHKVFLINNQSNKVKDVKLQLDYYVEIPHSLLKFSKTEQPFIPLDELVWEEIDSRGEVEFYVKLFSTKSAYGRGKFKITARAVPVKEV